MSALNAIARASPAETVLLGTPAFEEGLVDQPASIADAIDSNNAPVASRVLDLVAGCEPSTEPVGVTPSLSSHTTTGNSDTSGSGWVKRSTDAGPLAFTTTDARCKAYAVEPQLSLDKRLRRIEFARLGLPHQLISPAAPSDSSGEPGSRECVKPSPGGDRRKPEVTPPEPR